MLHAAGKYRHPGQDSHLDLKAHGGWIVEMKGFAEYFKQHD